MRFIPSLRPTFQRRRAALAFLAAALTLPALAATPVQGYKVVKTYPVAVGMPGHPTPTGLFHITDKQVNPVWSVPNSPWAGELAGTTVDGGSAANPLKARWMGITDGVGIHGTGEDASVGTRASHGCIRMHVPDVIALYPRVPVGTPVLLK
mgnify:CR=1 FL=1